MHKVTVLGSGNAFHSDGRGHACHLAETTAGERVLLDAGATALDRMARHGVSPDDLDAVLLTHFHGDHFLGVPCLLLHLNFIAGRTRPLTIAGPAGVARVVEDALALAYPGIELRFELAFRELTAGDATLGSVAVTAVPLVHRPESLGYRLTGPGGRVLAYSGDCRFDDALLRLVDGADLAMIELSLEGPDDPSESHVTLHDIRTRGKKLAAKRLLFVHLDDDLARAVKAEGLGEAARDGLEIVI